MTVESRPEHAATPAGGPSVHVIRARKLLIGGAIGGATAAALISDLAIKKRAWALPGARARKQQQKVFCEPRLVHARPALDALRVPVLGQHRPHHLIVVLPVPQK